MSVVESMRRDWDGRARKDAFYYVASWREGWNVPDFLASGEHDYQQLVQPVLDRQKFLPAGKTVLELGCGAGRMTRSFSIHFGRVVAFDVSSEMLERARQVVPDAENITWVRGNGETLGEAATESVDFVFSYLVLQHLPDKKLVSTYVREILRVLRQSGLCLFQVNGSGRPTMNWRGSLAWSLIDKLWAIRLGGLARAISRLFSFDPEMAGKSWHGEAVTVESMIEIVSASGGIILEVRGRNTPMLWICAQKETTLNTSSVENRELTARNEHSSAQITDHFWNAS